MTITREQSHKSFTTGYERDIEKLMNRLKHTKNKQLRERLRNEMQDIKSAQNALDRVY